MSGLDLYLSQRSLALLFVYAALAGFCLGALYDGLRILRMALGTHTERKRASETSDDPSAEKGRRSLYQILFLFIEDVVFALIACIALILLCYYANDGQIRWPAPAGLVGGFFVYRHTVSRLVLCVAEWILGLIRRILSACLHLLAMPIRWLWRLTVGRMMTARRERKTETRIQALTEAASRGFDVLGDHSKNSDPPA